MKMAVTSALDLANAYDKPAAIIRAAADGAMVKRGQAIGVEGWTGAVESVRPRVASASRRMSAINFFAGIKRES